MSFYHLHVRRIEGDHFVYDKKNLFNIFSWWGTRPEEDNLPFLGILILGGEIIALSVVLVLLMRVL